MMVLHCSRSLIRRACIAYSGLRDLTLRLSFLSFFLCIRHLVGSLYHSGVGFLMTSAIISVFGAGYAMADRSRLELRISFLVYL